MRYFNPATFDSPCLLGIDEAGRGPVLGPMVYACAFWPTNRRDELQTMKFKDSKVLTATQRDSLFEAILACSMGFYTTILSPSFISKSMLRVKKYNLNEISHDSVANLIQIVLDHGTIIKEVYVDTVGNPGVFKKKLSSSSRPSILQCPKKQILCFQLSPQQVSVPKLFEILK